MADSDQTPQDPIGSELVGEDASFADIVLQFVEGLSGRVKTMEDAIGSRDFDALRMAAHQLKGSGGGYGYPLLSTVASELEKRAKTQVLDDCTEAFDELKTLCERVVVDVDE